jgi:hypothetical protein
VYLVDLTEIPVSVLRAAVQSCGWENKLEEVPPDLDAEGNPDPDVVQVADGWVRFDADQPRAVLVEVLHGHGAACPAEQVQRNYASIAVMEEIVDLDKEADKVLTELAESIAPYFEDADPWNAAMDRIVNKIGSTGREFMQLDIISALLMGPREGVDPTTHALIAKIYGLKEKP